MNKIYALTDYKNYFGSKWKATPYRSGYDKDLLKEYFRKYGYEIEFIKISDIEFTTEWKERLIIYTSSEEGGLYYKTFIEDVVLALERLGAILIPRYDFLRANNNKVYMELLRDTLLGEEISGNKSNIYGTLEELKQNIEEKKISYPCVIKPASGAMSRGVALANNEQELIRNAQKISRTCQIKSEIKEVFRSIKHSGYKKESGYQNKFIVQNFIPGLKNDWKVLIYGDHFYVLNRGIKQNDFRASGSHYNYKAGSKAEFPLTMFDYIESIYKILEVPHLSLDFAFHGEKGYLIEFQAIHFGTSTLEFCDDYYTKENGHWIVKKQELDQEEEYVWGIVHFLK